MNPRFTWRILLTLSALMLTILLGCSHTGTPTGAESFPTSPDVYLDNFGPNVTFQAFLGSKLDALDIDATTSHSGDNSLIITVPDVGDPAGTYAGGAFTSTIARNLSQYNALTFWAKASVAGTLNVAGIGNDNTGTSRYTAEVNDLPLTTGWKQYVIPIPLASKLTTESGLFYFAEGPENGNGYTIWFDDIKYESLGTIINPQPTIPTKTIDAEIGDTLSVGSGSVTFDVNGTPVTVSAMQSYFTFFSSDTTVVKVAGNGVITAVGVGSAELTANLGSTAASGTVSVTVVTPTPAPAAPAPTPTVPAADVISLFSGAYTNVPVLTWSADWDIADVSDVTIGGDVMKKYENLSYTGVEFSSPTIDASGMNYFHMDIWTPLPIEANSTFKIKLVDFGADGAFGGGDDKEHELTFSSASNPALVSQNWVSINVPLAAFTSLTTTAHLAQMVISGSLSTVFVDNVYFFDAGAITEPVIPAPTPTKGSSTVISLYSDVYTNVPVDTWSATWDQADVADDLIGSDNVKKYTSVTVAGIEFTNQTVDASAMTNFHMDLWTPDPTVSPASLQIKLVDFGADGVFGGGDDVEHELSFDDASTPPLVTAGWISFDLPLSDFTNLTTKAHLAQLIITSDPNTLYIDNIYFYAEAPAVAAPTPTVPSSDVVSLFSDAYTDVPVDTWSAPWDSADVDDYVIGTDNVKRYTNVLFAGIEFANPTVDASGMTHFHVDLWTPDATDAPATLKVKIVDWGANGVYAGGDDVEHELTFDATTLETGTWFSIDVPLSRFTGLTTRGHLAQLIISGDPNTMYMDNLYFYDANLPTAPPTSAPTPTRAQADVISVFSDTYTSITVDNWSTVWDGANVADYMLGADNIKKYTISLFAAIDWGNSPIDATAMTGFHMDVWTPDPTDAPAVFKVKLVDFGANGTYGGGDDLQHELTFDHTTMNTGSWVGIDVPLSSFTGLTSRASVGQLIISGNPDTVYVDNIYFYK